MLNTLIRSYKTEGVRATLRKIKERVLGSVAVSVVQSRQIDLNRIPVFHRLKISPRLTI